MKKVLLITFLIIAVSAVTVVTGRGLWKLTGENDAVAGCYATIVGLLGIIIPIATTKV